MITSISTDWARNPRIVRITTTDDLATVITTGYLDSQESAINSLNNGDFQWEDGDEVLVFYNFGNAFFIRDPINNSLLPNGDGQVNAVAGTVDEINVDSSIPAIPIVSIALNPIIPGNEGMTPPIGTTDQRPSFPLFGEIRGNSDSGDLEYWNGSIWVDIPGEIGPGNVISDGTASDMQFPLYSPDAFHITSSPLSYNGVDTIVSESNIQIAAEGNEIQLPTSFFTTYTPNFFSSDDTFYSTLNFQSDKYILNIEPSFQGRLSINNGSSDIFSAWGNGGVFAGNNTLNDGGDNASFDGSVTFNNITNYPTTFSVNNPQIYSSTDSTNSTLQLWGDNLLVNISNSGSISFNDQIGQLTVIDSFGNLTTAGFLSSSVSDAGNVPSLLRLSNFGNSANSGAGISFRGFNTFTSSAIVRNFTFDGDNWNIHIPNNGSYFFIGLGDLTSIFTVAADGAISTQFNILDDSTGISKFNNFLGISQSSPAYSLDIGNISTQCGARFAVSGTTPTTPSNTNDLVLFNNSGVLSVLNTSGTVVPIDTAGGTVTNVTGTANQISVANPTTTPVISIVSNPIIPGLSISQAVITDGLGALNSLAYGSSNTVSTLVERDSSGNFSAGTITASLSGNATSSSSTAISSSSTNATFYPAFASATTGNIALNVNTVLNFNPSTGLLSSTGIASTTVNISGLSTSQAVVTDSSKNLASLAYTSANTATTLVERDGSGNFSAGTITASLNGNATTATTATTATNATNVGTTATSTNSSFFPTFVSSSSSGNQALDIASGISLNPSTNTITATTFSGNATTSTTATNATNVGTTSTTANIQYYLGFVGNTTGNNPLNVYTNLNIDPSTQILTTPNIYPYAGNSLTIGSSSDFWSAIYSNQFITGSLNSTTAIQANTAASAVIFNVNTSTPITTLNSAQVVKRTAVSGSYSILSTDYIVAYTSTSSAYTATLPTASGVSGQIVIVKDESGAANTNNITINVNGGGNIDGVASYAISQSYGSLSFYSNGTQWYAF